MAIENETPTTVDFRLPSRDTAVSLAAPASASPVECAALAAAIGAHLTDVARAENEDAESPVDRWKLAGRLGVRDPDRLPRSVGRGEEWKAAARTWQ